ncbi:AbiV family abortive infection protein [Flavobacterium sp. K5-23]|uniref:AbiV family abortive infection protein n=1 Tax=Flavobacterium sp. K5-23 TaxID=2746225 RepID=UPI00200C1AC1|nr:AbiV family abortive infection protein [Flavobacterium sp. K5-23]UQD57576.1 AbiV family abortive infection protein [Flavobacterium sp. K5-23]
MEKSSYQKIEELSNVKSENLLGFKSMEDYEKCLLHIENLLNSAILLYKNNFINQSFFLTITSIEEIAKAEVCIYRGFQKPDKTVKRNKDGLFNHKTKHLVAANEITFKFLKSISKIGIEETILIKDKLNNGEFVSLRESSLYFENCQNGTKTPNDLITKTDCLNLLLICIEIFEDRLFGFSDKTDIITDRVLMKLNEI